jgi:hypothetical protein
MCKLRLTLALALSAAAVVADRAAALSQLETLLAQTLPRRVAPTVNLSTITRRGHLGATYTPTVLMHVRVLIRARARRSNFPAPLTPLPPFPNNRAWATRAPTPGCKVLRSLWKQLTLAPTRLR